MSDRQQVELFQPNTSLQPKSMRKALGLAAMIIVLAVFMPDVLRSLENFLLTFFNTGTAILQAVPQSAEIARNFR